MIILLIMQAMEHTKLKPLNLQQKFCKQLSSLFILTKLKGNGLVYTAVISRANLV